MPPIETESIGDWFTLKVQAHKLNSEADWNNQKRFSPKRKAGSGGRANFSVFPRIPPLRFTYWLQIENDVNCFKGFGFWVRDVNLRDLIWIQLETDNQFTSKWKFASNLHFFFRMSDNREWNILFSFKLQFSLWTNLFFSAQPILCQPRWAVCEGGRGT